MSWFEMSRDSLRAARLAHNHGHRRSAVSRAYYAAYAALAGVFDETGGIDFRYEGNNPGHRQLLALTANNLDPRKFNKTKRQEIKRHLKTLQAMRINADYNPAESSLDQQESMIALRQVTALMIKLEVLHDA